MTCQSRPGSYHHELLDIATYCDWGVDYIKVNLHRVPRFAWLRHRVRGAQPPFLLLQLDGCSGNHWPAVNTSWIKFRAVRSLRAV